MDSFIAGPGTGADREVSAEITLKMQDKHSDVFIGSRCFKAVSPYRSMMMQSDTRYHRGA